MANLTENKYFGMIDFFLYFAPGTIVLLSLFLFMGIPPIKLKDYSSLATSIIAILVAYFFGHAIYPISYKIRVLLHRILSKKKSNAD